MTVETKDLLSFARVLDLYENEQLKVMADQLREYVKDNGGE